MPTLLKITLTETPTGFVLDVIAPDGESSWAFADGMAFESILDALPEVLKRLLNPCTLSHQ